MNFVVYIHKIYKFQFEHIFIKSRNILMNNVFASLTDIHCEVEKSLWL